MNEVELRTTVRHNMRGAPPPPSRSHSPLALLEFRKIAPMPKRKLEQVTEHITKHLERYVALEACFDAADIKTPPTQPGQPPVPI